MDTKLLEGLGLNPVETRLYEAVFKAGAIAPAALAKAAGVKRTTAYSIARGLVEKGILVEDATRRPRVFLPAMPEDIARAVDAEQKLFDEKKRALGELGAMVSRTHTKEAAFAPRVRFIESNKLKSYLYQAYASWYDSMQKTGETTYWGFQDATFVEHFGEWIDWVWERTPTELDLKLLTNLTPSEKKMAGKYPRRLVKYWGEATNFISSTWVTGDYVIMINTRQAPFYLVEIHDPRFAHDQREVFRNLWPLVP